MIDSKIERFVQKKNIIPEFHVKQNTKLTHYRPQVKLIKLEPCINGGFRTSYEKMLPKKGSFISLQK